MAEWARQAADSMYLQFADEWLADQPRLTEVEKKFLKEADAAGLESLKGHRSVGGARASIYNAMPMEGVQALVDFMAEFKKNN